LLSTSATLNRLNDETRSHHVDADAPWLALMRVDVRLEDYMRQLAVTYGFEAPLEGAFAYTTGLSEVICTRERVRAGLIAQDLLALGVTPSSLSELPQCFTITPFQDITDALGWMYVVERATLHHELVRRCLLRRLPDARRATAYLEAAGSIVGTRWQSFGLALDQHVANAKIAERVVAAADRALQRWCDWLNLTTELTMRTGDAIPELIVIDERSMQTIELCGDERRGLRCMLEKGHADMHESVATAGCVRWEARQSGRPDTR
jgi:heme oxygenase